MKIIRTYILYIAALLSVATAVLSCSAGVYDATPDTEGSSSERSILISGVVCSQDGQPLEDIAITFKSYPQNNVNADPIETETIYSNSKGEFTLKAEGAHFDLFCILTAEDPDGTYESQNQQILISWKGVSFDATSGRYIVNDCNFVLNRK